MSNNGKTLRLDHPRPKTPQDVLRHRSRNDIRDEKSEHLTGAELLFEVFSQRYERGSVLATANRIIRMRDGWIVDETRIEDRNDSKAVLSSLMDLEV